MNKKLLICRGIKAKYQVITEAGKRGNRENTRLKQNVLCVEQKLKE
ncbi:MAG: hypothetical protein N2V72_08035 [Methanophagales archaeon]|nr:hypothetical protein [Methanophagales archaeon]